jgi:hypothetical protein
MPRSSAHMGGQAVAESAWTAANGLAAGERARRAATRTSPIAKFAAASPSPLHHYLLEHPGRILSAYSCTLSSNGASYHKRAGQLRGAGRFVYTAANTGPANQRIAAFVDFLKHYKSSSTEAADQLEGLSLNGNGADEEYDMVDDSGDPVPNARNGNGKSKIKYLNQLQEVSNRERDEIVIDLNDVELVSGTGYLEKAGRSYQAVRKGFRRRGAQLQADRVDRAQCAPLHRDLLAGRRRMLTAADKRLEVRQPAVNDGPKD